MPLCLSEKPDGKKRNFIKRLIVRTCVRLVATGCVVVMSNASMASVIDCKSGIKATEFICGNAGLADTYGKMELAFGQLLKQSPDDEIRTTLQISQERWRSALDLAIEMLKGEGGVSDGEEAEDGDEQQTPEAVVMDNVAARLDDLSSREKDGTPTLIAKALKQRRSLAKFSGGSFSGFDTSCNFLPPDYNYYACFSTQHYQNGNRVCTDEEYWASGSVYENRFVGTVVSGKPELVASCTFNGNDTTCFSDATTDGGWNIDPQPHRGLYPAKPLPKLDVDVENEIPSWAESCLTDPHFPPASARSSGKGK